MRIRSAALVPAVVVLAGCGAASTGAGSAATATGTTPVAAPGGPAAVSRVSPSSNCPAPSAGGHLTVDMTTSDGGQVVVRLGAAILVHTASLLHPGDAVIANGLAPGTPNGMGADDVFSAPQAGAAQLIEIHDSASVAQVKVNVVDC